MGYPKGCKYFILKISDMNKLMLLKENVNNAKFKYKLGEQVLQLAINQYNKKPFSIHCVLDKSEKYRFIPINAELFIQIKNISKQNGYKLIEFGHCLLNKGIELYNKNKDK